MNHSLLSQLKNPERIKLLKINELQQLAKELRIRISTVVQKVGGHLGPNLGVVEIIIACHYVFNLAHDRLIFDVGHQVYPHKLLTGRNTQFPTLRQRAGISGYPHQRESRYDVFRSGHASTAISTALGMKRGSRLLRGTKSAVHVAALVGDGAMTGGMAFEGLNHTGHLSEPIIVILNDNSMSISPTVGGLARAMNYLRRSEFYQNLRDTVQKKVKDIPAVGSKVSHFTEQLLHDFKQLVSPSQIFTLLGFEYVGPLDGHNIPAMINALKKAKELQRPVLIHALTHKGLGYHPDGTNGKTIIGPHALSGANAQSDSKQVLEKSSAAPKPLSYSAVFINALSQLARRQRQVVGITAAMSEGTGLQKFAELFPQQYFDVGICEAHATGFAAGLAASKCRPVFVVYSTFLQRAFDQIFHDVVLQETLPVVFGIDRAGLVGNDGPSHHGLYDIAYLRIFPKLILMAPRDAVELTAMLSFALKQPGPVGIRYPKAAAAEDTSPPQRAPLRRGKAEVLATGKHLCIWAYGSMVSVARQAMQRLAPQGIHPTLINARFAKPLDEILLRTVLRTHRVVMTLEEGCEVGGLGSSILEAAQKLGHYTTPIKICGVPDKLIEHATRAEQLRSCRLDVMGITQRVRRYWKEFA